VRKAEGVVKSCRKGDERRRCLRREVSTRLNRN
jgi:hypothetical protein